MKALRISNSLSQLLAAASLLLLICSAAVAVKPSRPIARYPFGGTWQLNTRLSRNGQSELPRQLQSRGQLVAVATTEDWTRAEADPRTIELLQATESLDIIFHGRQLTINATGATDVLFTRTMFFDGRVATSERLLRAQLTNDSLVIESGASRMVIKETYRINQTTGQLLATFTFQSPKWSRGLTIERVYDRLLTSAQRRN